MGQWPNEDSAINKTQGAGRDGHDGAVPPGDTHALQWCLTGKEAHARKAIEILNAWSATLKTVSGHDTKLLIGMTGVQICNAAELLRHTWNGWLKPDQERFERLLREVLIITMAGKASKCRIAGKWLPKDSLGGGAAGRMSLGAR